MFYSDRDAVDMFLKHHGILSIDSLNTRQALFNYMEVFSPLKIEYLRDCTSRGDKYLESAKSLSDKDRQKYLDHLENYICYGIYGVVNNLGKVDNLSCTYIPKYSYFLYVIRGGIHTYYIMKGQEDKILNIALDNIPFNETLLKDLGYNANGVRTCLESFFRDNNDILLKAFDFDGAYEYCENQFNGYRDDTPTSILKLSEITGVRIPKNCKSKTFLSCCSKALDKLRLGNDRAYEFFYSLVIPSVMYSDRVGLVYSNFISKNIYSEDDDRFWNLSKLPFDSVRTFYEYIFGKDIHDNITFDDLIQDKLIMEFPKYYILLGNWNKDPITGGGFDKFS